jgi:hypothetical protein
MKSLYEVDSEEHDVLIQRIIGKKPEIFIFISLLGLITAIYSIYSQYEANTLSPIDFMHFIFLNTLFDVRLPCLLILILISVFLYYKWRGYDLSLRLLGVNFAFFTYIGFIFLISGSVMLSLPQPVSNQVNVNSTSLTEINFHYSNTTDPQNFTLISSYNFTNITKNEEKNNATDSSSSMNKAIEKLNSGLFGNGIGIVALALTLVGLGLSSYDKIQTSKMEEEILLRQQKKEYLLKKYKPALTNVQIQALGMIWIFGAVIIDIILGFSIGFQFHFLPFLSELSLMFSGILIEIFGLILLIYAYLKTKEPPEELVSYTFDELIQKINAESRLK